MFHKIFINASLLSILLFGSVSAVQTIEEGVQDPSETKIVSNEINGRIINQEGSGDNSLIIVVSDEIDNISLNIEESEEVVYREEGPFVHFSKKSDIEFFKGFELRDYGTNKNGGIKEIDGILYLYAFDLDHQPSYGAAEACECEDNVKLKFTGQKKDLGEKCYRAKYHFFVDDIKYGGNVYLLVSTKSPVVRSVPKDCVFSFEELSEYKEFLWRSASHNKVFKCSFRSDHRTFFNIISTPNKKYELKLIDYVYPNQMGYTAKLYSDGEYKKEYFMDIKSIN
jgi:hypothetical protein